MSKAFVWFHNGSKQPKSAAGFYEKLLGWKSSSGPAGLTLLSGDQGPLAAVGAPQGVSGWVPYAEVADVDSATAQATELGAQVLQERTKGPAGDFTIVRDPGGAAFALWQKA